VNIVSRYVYVVNLIRDISEALYDYAGEVEHQFKEEYAKTSKKELFDDFAMYLKQVARED